MTSRSQRRSSFSVAAVLEYFTTVEEIFTKTKRCPAARRRTRALYMSDGTGRSTGCWTGARLGGGLALAAFFRDPPDSGAGVSRRFSTLWQRGKKHYSDVLMVGGCPWRLSLYPKGLQQ